MEDSQHQRTARDSELKRRRHGRPWTGLLLLAVSLLLAGVIPVAAQTTAPSSTAIQVREEIPEDLLIDVAIQVFDPGLTLHDKSDWEKKRIYPEVRKSEARYLPVNLMNTLQATGQWGAVRVVPIGVESMDLAVAGQIVESSGKELVLQIRAVDITGRIWLEDRYKERVEQEVYEQENGQLIQEPFQPIYNRIANDLLAARKKLKDDELRHLREINQLRFAASLAPYFFDDYLGYDKKGRVVVERLPAEDDPMVERIDRIRDRDDLFIDTLSEHYATFASDMDEAYDNWRMFSYEEQVMFEKLRRKARTRKILGIASIIGGVVLGSEMDDPRVGGAVSDAGIFGGIIAISSGVAKSQEAKFHAESLSELASSFDSEIEPLLVDVEGQTLRLQGSVETQYATWKKLLKDLFVSETGLPIDPDSGDVAATIVAANDTVANDTAANDADSSDAPATVEAAADEAAADEVAADSEALIEASPAPSPENEDAEADETLNAQPSDVASGTSTSTATAVPSAASTPTESSDNAPESTGTEDATPPDEEP